MPKIDENYFSRYDGEKTYDEVWEGYSGIIGLVNLIDKYKLPHQKICILGTATGRILETVNDKLGVKAYGCEFWKEAYLKTPLLYKGRIKCMDMRDYIKEKRKYDILFSNSLFYLQENEIEDFLFRCSKICKYFYFEGFFDTKDVTNTPDKYRTITQPYKWWAARFKINFTRTKSIYLWRSNVNN